MNLLAKSLHQLRLFAFLPALLVTIGYSKAGAQTDAATSFSCPGFFESEPRGLACMHCLQREAQGQARAIAQILRHSCLQTIAINYLVNGSFGDDYTFLDEQIRFLTADGQELHLVLYLANGPSQRRWQTTKVPGFPTSTPPAEFRTAIRSDQVVRSRFKAIVKALEPTLMLATHLGVKLYLVPMLEDNLDDAAFNAMAGLLKESVNPAVSYQIGRNPCPGCFPGNSGNTPAGMFTEKHGTSPQLAANSKIVTNDGTHYVWPAPAESQSSLVSLEDLARMRDSAGDYGSIFILWSASRQGLVMEGQDIVADIAPPAERQYPSPGVAEMKALIQFLRDGLPFQSRSLR